MHGIASHLLLSYLVANATGKTWEEQLNSEILQPLDMNNATLRPTLEQERRLAQGIIAEVRMRRAGRSSPGTPPADCAQRHTA